MDSSVIVELDKEDDNMPLITLKTPTVQDFVLVRFSGKQIKFFIGQILSAADENHHYDIKNRTLQCTPDLGYNETEARSWEN